MNTSFNFITEKTFQDELEKVIDSKGYNYILQSLSRIANEKANHLRENWQDEATAKCWDKTEDKIEVCRALIENICPLF